MKKNFQAKEIIPHCWHLTFPTKAEMGRTLLRFQEHYESPRYRGKIFTLKEFKEWYRKAGSARINRKGQKQKSRFNYNTDWSGYNFPSYILKAFYEGKFKKITSREQAILDFFQNKGENFYIIATTEKDESESLDHEITHALFYLKTDYRNRITKVIKKRKRSFGPLCVWLKEQGYCKEVEIDEINAYMSCDFNWLIHRKELPLEDLEVEAVYLSNFRDKELEQWKKDNLKSSWIDRLKKLSQRLRLRKRS